MIGTLAALAVVYWFYQSAESHGKKPLPSALLGFIVYLVPAVVWTLVVTPNIRASVEHSPNFFFALIAQYAYILVALACAAFVRFRHFSSNDDNQ